MTDIVIIVILALLLGGALGYIQKSKKAGIKCVGCPDSAACSSKKGGSCNCQ